VSPLLECDPCIGGKGIDGQKIGGVHHCGMVILNFGAAAASSRCFSVARMVSMSASLNKSGAFFAVPARGGLIKPAATSRVI
jgi:hypothetical protein